MEETPPGVLLVDDEMHIRMFIKAVLMSLNYRIIGEAGNGRDAVQKYKELKPDLVLMDINMPVKTGEEALGEIISENPEASVIMLTSLADMETIERCLSMGAVNYIRKDSPIDEMKSLIQETWQGILQQRNNHD